MESDIDISASPAEVLSAIDKMHNVHRLSKVREFARQLSWTTRDFIGKGIEEATAEELILLIWERNRFEVKATRIIIPPELTFGEPYDSQFSWIIKENQSSKVFIQHILSYAYKYVEKLRFYMIVQLSSIKNCSAAVRQVVDETLVPLLDPARKIFHPQASGPLNVVKFLKTCGPLDVIVVSFHLFYDCSVNHYDIIALILGCIDME